MTWCGEVHRLSIFGEFAECRCYGQYEITNKISTFQRSSNKYSFNVLRACLSPLAPKTRYTSAALKTINRHANAVQLFQNRQAHNLMADFWKVSPEEEHGWSALSYLGIRQNFDHAHRCSASKDMQRSDSTLKSAYGSNIKHMDPSSRFLRQAQNTHIRERRCMFLTEQRATDAANIKPFHLGLSIL